LNLRIGIDLGGSKTEGIVMHGNGEILARERRATPAEQGYAAILDGILALIVELENSVGRTCRIGIGTPGAVSTVSGTIKNSNTTCLNGKPLHKDLQLRLNRPIRIANDANCFALSEAIDGAARDYPSVFGVIMGTGVGGGIVINRQLHLGAQHIAGEWGHNVLEADGPACYCGRHGCVETLISGPGLAHDYQRHAGGTAADARAIIELANGGNEQAEAAVRRFLERFGRALATVINILDPHAIVIGGGLSHIERLYHEGRDHAARYVFNDELRTAILPNKHGDSSGVRGAARLWSADE
jgi:fructokinase